MSLIRKPAEIVGKETIAALIYGQSGMGKTTLACSAPNPVLFDFDGGVARIRDEHQVPTVQITKWQEALDALEEVANDGGEYRTIIIDTASKMIDSIIVHVCGTAQPKINQWGIINAAFKNFLRSVQSFGKNVVFIAQREVEKSGEDIRYVPQFRSSNYKDVICDLDVCGYMEMVNYKGQSMRQITFNPTERNEGKNTAEFQPAYLLPNLTQGTPNTFLSERFIEYSAKQREKTQKKVETAKIIAEVMNGYADELANCQNADDINAVLEKAKTEKAVGDLLLRLRQRIKERATTLGLTLNKEKRCYE